jgi:hypothetical protein
MVLFGFDIFITRDYIKRTHKRPPIWIEQGDTPDDWEAGIGPWYVVVSRIPNRTRLPSH